MDGKRESHIQRDMPRPSWLEDPLSEPLTGKAAARFHPLPASGGLNHLTLFAVLSSSSRPFLPPPILSPPCTPHMSLFLWQRAPWSWIFLRGAITHHCSRSSWAHLQGPGAWPACLCPGRVPKGDLGLWGHHSLCCRARDSMLNLACFSFAFSPQALGNSVW